MDERAPRGNPAGSRGQQGSPHHAGGGERPPPHGGADSDALGVLLRWTTAGGTFSVLRLDDDGASVALETCLGGEVVDRLESADPGFIAWLNEHPDLS